MSEPAEDGKVVPLVTPTRPRTIRPRTLRTSGR